MTNRFVPWLRTCDSKVIHHINSLRSWHAFWRWYSEQNVFFEGLLQISGSFTIHGVYHQNHVFLYNLVNTMIILKLWWCFTWPLRKYFFERRSVEPSLLDFNFSSRIIFVRSSEITSPRQTILLLILWLLCVRKVRLRSSKSSASVWSWYNTNVAAISFKLSSWAKSESEILMFYEQLNNVSRDEIYCLPQMTKYQR